MSSYREQCEGPALRCASDAKLQQEFLGYRIDAYLRSKGWKPTSSTPGALWLWERKLPDGRAVLVSQSAALHMQAFLEPDPDEEADREQV